MSTSAEPTSRLALPGSPDAQGLWLRLEPSGRAEMARRLGLQHYIKEAFEKQKDRGTCTFIHTTNYTCL